MNVLTFLALVLAIGLIVDDSIVVLENIKRRLDDGESPIEASVLGAKQITFVVIATTLFWLAYFYHYLLWMAKLEDYSLSLE